MKENFTIRIDSNILQFARQLAETESKERGETVSVNRIFSRWIRFAYKCETTPFFGNQNKLNVKRENDVK